MIKVCPAKIAQAYTSKWVTYATFNSIIKNKLKPYILTELNENLYTWLQRAAKNRSGVNISLCEDLYNQLLS